MIKIKNVSTWVRQKFKEKDTTTGIEAPKEIPGVRTTKGMVAGDVNKNV